MRMICQIMKKTSKIGVCYNKLMQYKETELPEGELLHEVCALYSISNLNEQMCNGGFMQYYENRYHEFLSGQNMGDLSNLDISEQVVFLHKFIMFILLDRDKRKYSKDLKQLFILFKEMPGNIELYECFSNQSSIEGTAVLDKYWRKVSKVISCGLEMYAKYLLKRLEMIE